MNHLYQHSNFQNLLAAVVKGFLDETLRLILADWLVENNLPSLDDVRIVFWFDN